MKTFSLLELLLVGGAVALPSNVRDVSERGTSVKYAGINIAGFDFGMNTNGGQDIKTAYPPLLALGGADGAGQMNHFVKDDKMNIFRLPVGWQYLTGYNLGGTLNAGNLGKYDQLVQECLKTSASTVCIVDIHSYARWDNKIVGQGGPSDSQFVSLWTQLATKYKSNPNVAFGLMNEPHEVDINKWADTLQQVVTGIRNAGAISQMIYLPGNDYSSAGAFPYKSAAALSKVKNPDGSFTNLIFDVHEYLDKAGGKTTECVTDNIAESFQPLATWLRANKRQAILTETGGGNTASCIKFLCQQLRFMDANSDVYLGYVGWSAGGFDATYELSETPVKSGNSWTDTSLVQSCLKR